MSISNIIIGYIRNAANNAYIMAIIHSYAGGKLLCHTDEGEKSVSVNDVVFSIHSK